MGFLTTILNAAGGYGQGLQQKRQNQQDQQRQASETAYQSAQIEEEKARTAEEQRSSNLQATEQGYDPNTLKPLPLTGKGYQQIAPTDDYNTIATKTARNYALAVQQNDQQGIATWGKAAATIPRGYEETTTGAYTAGAKTDLTEAQAGWWKQKHSEVMAALQAREREVGEQQGGAMQRAYLSARTRTDIAGRSADEREAIAMQTALNLATYHNEDQAYRAAVDEANRADAQNLAVWKAQNEAAARTGGQLSAPPQLQPIVIPQGGNAGGQPITINIVDPRTGQIKTVSAPKTPPAPARPSLRLPIAQEIANARRAGWNDNAQIAHKLISEGYSQTDVNRALYGANSSTFLPPLRVGQP